ncbi:MAG: uracil-DNA glycosylase [Owenweeksia sp.]
MSSLSPKIHTSWLYTLQEEFNKEYFSALKSFLVDEKSKYRIYPPGPLIFSAYDHTPFDQVKVVIIGQDPYHGPGQANGLSFSVSDGVSVPPSLKNIYKELLDDTGASIPNSGNLEKWAERGVLLLNAVLSVRERQPGSHRNQGWETFTDATIKALSEKRENLVFILWGKFAQSKKELIDQDKHYIIESPHPSPYSANSGFFGSRPFSKTNSYLKSVGKDPIDWQL